MNNIGAKGFTLNALSTNLKKSFLNQFDKDEMKFHVYS